MAYNGIKRRIDIDLTGSSLAALFEELLGSSRSAFSTRGGGWVFEKGIGRAH